MSNDDKQSDLLRRIICAQLECAGMQAENQQRLLMNESIAYNEQDFQRLIVKYKLEEGHG